MALLMFAWVASERRIEAASFIETASPPASSTELLILNPLESLVRLFCMLAVVLPNVYAAHVDAILVFSVTILYSFT